MKKKKREKKQAFVLDLAKIVFAGGVLNLATENMGDTNRSFYLLFFGSAFVALLWYGFKNN